MMTNKIWDELSKSYQHQFYTSEYILMPAVMSHLKNIAGKKVLDMGCGTGYFSEALFKEGAIVTGVDSSSEMIKIAGSNNKKIKYIIGNAEKIQPAIKDKFDYIICSMFFCCISSSARFQKIFKELEKYLKKHGKLIIVDYHPRGYRDMSAFLLEHKFPKDFNYFNGPRRFKVGLRNKNNELLSFFDYHWKIEDYFKVTRNSKLLLREVKALSPSKNLKIKGQEVLRPFKENPVYMLLEISKQ